MVLVCRWFIGLLLLTSGLGKTINLREFRKLLLAYEILPKSVVPTAAYLLPGVEITTGSLLIANRSPLLFGLVAGCLFTLFTVGISINLARGRRQFACGCFGRAKETISWGLVLRNVVLTSLALSSAGLFVKGSLLLAGTYAMIRTLSMTYKWRKGKMKDVGPHGKITEQSAL